jgi:hypothetical protein
VKTKKSKFATIIFSFLPGAGHMFMGFMKMGISFMSAFFFIIFLSTWLKIGPLLFVLPLIWFYSFFDCINKRYMPDQEFLKLEDKYLFSIDSFTKFDKGIFKKRRLIIGILVILLGIYLIWNNVSNMLYGYIDSKIYNIINNLAQIAPQIIIGVIIIIVGIKLIAGKKREDKMND